jgi:tetratricopeptide (TPR) repeat protein
MLPSLSGSLLLIFQHQNLDSLLDKTILLAPDAEKYSQRAKAWMEEDELDSALSDINHAISLDSVETSYVLNRGIIYGKLGKDKKEIADYNKAITMDSTNPRAYFIRGKYYSDHNKYDLAIADFPMAIHLDPANPQYWYSRGLCYYSKLDNLNARKDFGEALRLDPANRNYQAVYREAGGK